MRFVGWLIGILLITGLMITVVVGLARHDPTPNLLQRVGFDVCDERPCFRGIWLGMDWQAAHDLLKDSSRSTFPTELNVDIGEGNLAMARLNANEGSVVSGILTVRTAGTTSMDVRLGDVWLMYGEPCRVGRLIDVGTNEDRFVLVYPTMAVMVSSVVVQMQSPNPIVTFRPTSSVEDIWIMTSGLVGDCVSAPFGEWLGFASSPTYLRDYQKRYVP